MVSELTRERGRLEKAIGALLHLEDRGTGRRKKTWQGRVHQPSQKAPERSSKTAHLGGAKAPLGGSQKEGGVGFVFSIEQTLQNLVQLRILRLEGAYSSAMKNPHLRPELRRALRGGLHTRAIDQTTT